MKTCIITGATGYIGSHVLKYLLRKGWNIHIVTRHGSGYANVAECYPGYTYLNMMEISVT